MLRRRSPEPEQVPAWLLGEGDLLPDGVTVLSVQREPRSRTVRVATDEPAVAVLPADSPVLVVLHRV